MIARALQVRFDLVSSCFNDSEATYERSVRIFDED
jgi:hypothetical protein